MLSLKETAIGSLRGPLLLFFLFFFFPFLSFFFSLEEQRKFAEELLKSLFLVFLEERKPYKKCRECCNHTFNAFGLTSDSIFSTSLLTTRDKIFFQKYLFLKKLICN